MAKTLFIESHRIKHMLKVTAISSESRERNVALLYVLSGCGLMLTEIARLALSDYLNEDGTIKDKSLVRAEIAYNGKARPLYWSSPGATAALDKYLECRLTQRHGITTRTAAYPGHDPDTALFRTGDGEPYRLIVRTTATGAISYSCDSLSQLFRKLHLQAGIEGASAASGRRTFAVRLHQKGYDLRHINELLVHETLTATKNLIDADPVRLGAIVAGVI